MGSPEIKEYKNIAALNRKERPKNIKNTNIKKPYCLKKILTSLYLSGKKEKSI
jgi:hypothetical protein